MEIKDILLKHLYVIYDSTTSEDLVTILKELYGIETTKEVVDSLKKELLTDSEIESGIFLRSICQYYWI